MHCKLFIPNFYSHHCVAYIANLRGARVFQSVLVVYTFCCQFNPDKDKFIFQFVASCFFLSNHELNSHTRNRAALYLHAVIEAWGPFLESLENFRKHIGWHNSHCILKAQTFEARNFAAIWIFISFTKYEKTSFTKYAGYIFMNDLSGQKSFRDFRAAGTLTGEVFLNFLEKASLRPKEIVWISLFMVVAAESKSFWTWWRHSSRWKNRNWTREQASKFGTEQVSLSKII